MPLLILLFIALPILELLVIVQVARGIGVLPTVALLFLTGVAGAILLRSQGREAWRRFNLALSAGRIPARETADGAMIIFGGALLLTPGFLTDVVGLALLVPPTRALVRRGLGGMARRRITFGWGLAGRVSRRPSSGEPGQAGPGPAGPYHYEGTAEEVTEPAPGDPEPVDPGRSSLPERVEPGAPGDPEPVDPERPER
jgi:UPF0716 protein FxsA